MKIKTIEILIETEDETIKTIFVTDKSILGIMSSNDSFYDLVLDIINNAKEDENN